MIFLSRFQDELIYMTAWSGVWVGAPFPRKVLGSHVALRCYFRNNQLLYRRDETAR